ncbi:aspartate kinase [Bacillus taeanensis]|uniref:Aspartokinase n=1 Tax=Bacillus taeanensis TaxID=273032 RepID=A0A366XT34_9BACI|nr:aspartate kinase [Bacillus taeanensis]RBW69057.1 aspartate kinase [Bacillus taeanensis]
MKVAKFGGSSVASAEQIKKVCNIITADAERRLVVVSAPGKRCKEDEKTTDLLIALADQYLLKGSAEAELQKVIARYEDIAQNLNLGTDIIEEIRADLKARLAIDTNNPGLFMDSLKASGEDNNAKLIANYLQSLGIEAHYINPKEAGLLVSNEAGNAQVLPESYDNLYKLREKSGILIFPGFFGYSPEGTLVTFPRGGSDITGAILAAAVQADLYENFTDVDSVYVVNPNLVENPQEISELTYSEMRELSYAGFSVFHEEALAPAVRASIPVCIKNTNNPSAPGTKIIAKRQYALNPVVGIASDTGFLSIYVEKYLMNREIGFGRKLLQILEEEHVSYEHTPSGIDSISVILRANQLNAEKEMRLVERIKNELKVDKVEIERGLALIMIVGEAMHQTIGIAARAVSAIQRSNVNIEMINQGSSEVSMMFGVKEEGADKAVRSIYEEYFEKSYVEEALQNPYPVRS